MGNALWLVYALLAAVTGALVALFGKMGLQGVDSNVATAVRSVIMAVFLLGVIAVQGKLSLIPVITGNRRALCFIALSGVAGALSWLFYFLALRLGKVGQVAPVDRLSVVFAIVLAYFFLGEKISLQGGMGVGLMVVGAILVALA
ncbi:EamA family transporter [Paenibacillus aurantius]|uniref:EamA family transporter n=1 Tax=Paenibacillus aurantius TaxID=2918900 RepID=A0AA96RFG9_9BACL|nr:EamA family transporter [Paenibacillus aurantius]WNQ11233.1 EamA family transporter [Paenibacillus aurantius]